MLDPCAISRQQSVLPSACYHLATPMPKDFDRWNVLKKTTDAVDEEARLFYREGEIWWVRLGKNIGYELDGKSREFTRPVIILKKYNQYSFLALPLTTAQKPNPYRLPIGVVDGKDAFATLSQLRNIDSKRLVKKIAVVSGDALDVIKKEASRVNFG
jgi:mRNA interferase MazF